MQKIQQKKQISSLSLHYMSIKTNTEIGSNSHVNWKRAHGAIGMSKRANNLRHIHKIV